MAEKIRITERHLDDVTILELDGRLVLDDGDLIFRDCVNRLIQQGQVKIVVDMQRVTRLDSAGIGMLVSKYVTTYTRGGRLKLLNLTNRGAALIDVTKLHTVFEMFESEAAAVRSFDRPQPIDVQPPGRAGDPDRRR